MTEKEFLAIKERDRDLGLPLDLSPLDEAEVDRRHLIAEVEMLRENLRIENLNKPFYNELTNDFEEALGAHPTIPNGQWIRRCRELRQEVERLTSMLR